MDVNKTIDFILDQQARFEANQARLEANFAKADGRFAQAERRLDRLERLVGQNNRLVARLARAGVSFRSDVRRHERAILRIEENLAEATDKLNGLIDFVDKQSRKNGGG